MITDSLPPQTPRPEPMGMGRPSRATARPRWLVAAVVAVVVLAMLIGLVAGFTINSRRTGGAASAAAGYVPANASMYYELRLDLPGDQRTNFETLLGHFPDQAASTILGDGLDTLLDGGASAQPSGLHYTTDLKPWFDGSLAAAMIGWPKITNPTQAAAAMPDMLVFAGVKDAEAARSALDRIRTGSGATGISSTTHGGFTIWSLPPTSSAGISLALAWTVTDDEVVVGTSSDLVASALDVHAGSQPSLAGRQEFKDGLARLPADRVATFSVDTAPILDQLQPAIASAAPSAASLFDALSAQGSQFFMGSARIEGDRLVMDESSALPSGSSLENRDYGLAAAAPADAFLFADAGNVGTSLAASMGALTQALGTSVPADQLQQLQSLLGGDLSSVVSWIGDAAIVAGISESEPYAGIIITPTDAHEASVRLLQLQGLLQLSGSGGGPAVTVTDTDHGGTRITTITFAGVPAAEQWAGTIQYAVTDTRVVIGTGTSFVARVLDMTAADSLAEQARFKAAVDAVGGASNTGMTWLDLAAIRTAVEGAMGIDDPAGRGPVDRAVRLPCRGRQGRLGPVGGPRRPRRQMSLESLRLPAGETPDRTSVKRFLRAAGVEPYAWSNGPGDRYAAHEHGFTKLLMCAAGSISFLLDDGAALELHPGEGFVLPAGTRHSAVVGPAGCTCLEGHR